MDNSVPTEQIFMKVYVGDFYKNLPRKIKFVKTEQKYHAIYMET